MSGFRDIALNAKELEENGGKEPYRPSGTLFGNRDDDDGYEPPSSNKGFQSSQPDPAGSLKIFVTVPVKSIGPIADYNDHRYNYDKAVQKAEEYSYDQIVTLAGTDFIERYSINSMTVQEEDDDYFEIAILLVPVS